MNRISRIVTYHDTKEKCLKGTYGPMKPGKSYLMKRNNKRLNEINMEKKFNGTEIEVLNDDVLAVAKHYNDRGDSNILVLNLASDYVPGGGVESGAMAQEEELFRRTNYFMSLDNTFYPFDAASVIYTPNVIVVKDKSYEDMIAPFGVSMLAAAAIRSPVLNIDGTYNEKDYDRMYDTIHNIFKVAYMMKHETLILGAIGCGAFRNPPKEVAKIYNIFLKAYMGCFKRIIFAVYSIKDDNFDYFNKLILRK